MSRTTFRAGALALALPLGLIGGAPAAHAQDLDDVVGRLSEIPQFSLLVEAIQAAGLGEELEEAGPLTVFAPTDAAFRELPQGALERLMADEDLLAAVVLHHVVPGAAYTADDLPERLEPAFGSPLDVGIAESGAVLRPEGGRQVAVIEGDILAENGIIHAIEGVVIPREVAQALPAVQMQQQQTAQAQQQQQQGQPEAQPQALAEAERALQRGDIEAFHRALLQAPGTLPPALRQILETDAQLDAAVQAVGPEQQQQQQQGQRQQEPQRQQQGAAQRQPQTPGTAVAGQTPAKLTKEELQELAPGLGYLRAHKDVQNPLSLLGGPVSVKVTQEGGTTRVILPGHREMDMRVFGVPGLPRSFAGTPLANGVPPDLRGIKDGRYTQVTQPSPASDNWTDVRDGTLTLEATDVTATDAAVTQDSVRFEASWKDDRGNTYTVRADKAVPNGVEYPVFGGVVTNHLMHGFTRIGTALMPTEFAYLAFWAMGETLKNGEVMEAPVIVHGMLTERVRVDGYQLAHDDEVVPTDVHFHLMVPAVMPKRGELEYQHDPVDTGFTTPDGKELPFWHVMFEDVRVQGARGAGIRPEQTEG